MNEPKKWYEDLFEILASLFTTRALAAVGGPPSDDHSSATLMLELPGFPTGDEPPNGLETSTDLAHCNAEMRRRYEAMRAEFEATTGRQLIVTRTYSSPAHQFELFKQGRHLASPDLDPTEPRNWIPDDPVHHAGIVTNCDGYHVKSRHNRWPSEAVDSAVDTDPGPGKHVVWDHASYAPLGPLAEKHGLIWGGGWRSIHDDPHTELPAEAV
jgi:hypothetical protein